MTKTRDIVQAAFRKIAVSALGETMSADAADEGLFALNKMMHAWKSRGVDIEHEDLGLSDEFPMPPQFHEGAVYLLATRLSPDFIAPAAFDADQYWRDLQATYSTLPTLTVPAAVLRPPSREDREGNLPLVER